MRWLFCAAVLLMEISIADASDRRIGSWIVDGFKDPVTGSPKFGMIAYSDQRERIDLQLRCIAGKPQIVVGAPERDFTTEERRWIVLRVNEDEPTLNYAGTGVGTNKLFLSMSKINHARLSQSRKVVFRIFKTENFSNDIVFILKRTPEAFKLFEKYCPLESAFDRPRLLFQPDRKLPEFPKAGDPASYPEKDS